MRNRTVQIDRNGQESLLVGLLLFHSKRFCQCQEKPRNEALAVLLCQPAVVVQILLQVGESALYLVVRVRHPFAVFPLEGEEIWQIEVKAAHRCSQASVRIVHLTVSVEAFMANRVLPLQLSMPGNLS